MFNCDKCDKKFNKESELTIHKYKKHKKIIKYYCEYEKKRRRITTHNNYYF